MKVVHGGFVHLIHMDRWGPTLLGAVVAKIFVSLADGPYPVHFSPTLAVNQAAAQIPGLLPGLLSLCHNALHLHKLGLADDLRQGIFYSDGVRLAAPLLPAFLLLGGINICAGVLLIS